MSQLTDFASDQRPNLIGVASLPEASPQPTKGDRMATTAIRAGILAIGLLGFINSFAAVQAAAVPYLGDLSWSLPLGVDLAIGVYAATEISYARGGMKVPFLKPFAWFLIAGTVFLNVANETELYGFIAHGILPLLWVVSVEVIAYEVRKKFKLSSNRRMDAIRLSRWILSPISTFFLWRRSVLWETRSYEAALRRERDRAYAKADLQERYGRRWRSKATRRERVEYKLGELVPTELKSAVEEDKAVLPEYTETNRGLRTKDQKAPTIEELFPVGMEIAQELAKENLPLTRDRLLDRLKQRGTGLGTGRGTELLNRIKAECKSAQAAA